MYVNLHAKACDDTFEVVQSINDEPISQCPKCSGPVSKMFYPVGISFKGSGFHINDYKSPKQVTAEKESSSSGSGEGSKTPSNGDSGNSSCSSCAKAESCPK
ncbi:MAG: FmdB family transcriptional regulator [Rubrobacteridae bacterium]|nr:FmdB family transcriptional regulator [Rubrobacteridae bacterium]